MDKVSKNRSDKLRKIVKRAKDIGIDVIFGYESDLSEEVAKRVGVDYLSSRRLKKSPKRSSSRSFSIVRSPALYLQSTQPA